MPTPRSRFPAYPPNIDPALQVHLEALRQELQDLMLDKKVDLYIVQVVPYITASRVLQVVVVGNANCNSVKIAASKNGFPSLATVRGKAAQALDQDKVLATSVTLEEGGNTVDPTETAYITVLGYSEANGKGRETNPVRVTISGSSARGAPAVIAAPSQSGGNGKLTLTIYDPEKRVTSLQNATKTSAGSDFSAYADSWDATGNSGTPGTDIVLVRVKTIPLLSAHQTSIAWKVIWTDETGTSREIGGSHTFDADFIADIQGVDVTVNSPTENKIVVNYIGDEDTAKAYVRVGIDAVPADPTATTNDGFATGRTGAIATAIVCPPGSTAYVKVRGENSAAALGPVYGPVQFKNRGSFAPEVKAEPSQSGSTGTLTLTITDLDKAVTSVEYALKTDAGGYGAFTSTGWDSSTGTPGIDTSLTRGKNIALVSGHQVSIKWRVIYTAPDGASKEIGGSHTFDANAIADVSTPEISFESSGRVVVSASGDEDTEKIYVTVAVSQDGNTAPPDPTTASPAVINGRQGIVDTGVVCGEGWVAFVKVRGWNAGSLLGPVVSAKLRRPVTGDTGARWTPQVDGWSTTQNALAPENGAQITVPAGGGSLYSNLEDANSNKTTYYVRYDVYLSTMTEAIGAQVRVYHNDGPGSTNWTQVASKSYAAFQDFVGEELSFEAALGQDYDLRLEMVYDSTPTNPVGVLKGYGEADNPPGVSYSRLDAPIPVTSGGTGQTSLASSALLVGAGSSPVSTLAPGAQGHVVRSTGTVWAAAQLNFSDLAGTAARNQLPAAVAYEDEVNIFTAKQRLEAPLEFKDLDATPVADRRLRVIDGLLRATTTLDVEGRYISKASIEQLAFADLTGNLAYSQLPTGTGTWDIGVGNTLTFPRTLSVNLLTLTNPLGVTSGGTGLGTIPAGSILWANGQDLLTTLAHPGDGYWLKAEGTTTPTVAWRQISFNDITGGPLGIAKGGTGATTAGAAFNNLSPLSQKGDLLTYDPLTGGNVPVLPRHTTAEKKFLTSTGTGTEAGLPTWDVILAADLPAHTHSVNDITGVMPVTKGGTGLSSIPAGAILWANALDNLTTLAHPGTVRYLRANVDAFNNPVIEWDQLDVGDLSGVVQISQGGTGATTAGQAFNNLSPLSVTGDILVYDSVAGGNVKLAGNTETTKKFLTSTGTGAAATVPSWQTILAADVPQLSYEHLPSGAGTWSASPTISGLLTPAGGIAYATGVQHYWDNGSRQRVYYGRWGVATSPGTSAGKWLKVAEFDHPTAQTTTFHLVVLVHGRLPGVVQEATPTVVYASIRRATDAFAPARVAIYSLAEYPAFDDVAIVHRSGGAGATARVEVWVRCRANWCNQLPVEIRVNYNATLVSLATDHVAEQASITAGYVAILAQRSVDTYPSFYVEGPATVSKTLQANLLTLTNPLDVIYGGTGLGSINAGAILWASSPNVLTTLAHPGVSGRYLRTDLDASSNPILVWDQLDMGDLSGVLQISQGGTGATTAGAAFNNLSPLSVTGDILTYDSAQGGNIKLAGNATTTKKFLTSTGTGTAATVPQWSVILAADLPPHTHSAADITSGVLAVARGGTGASTASAAFNNLAPSTTKGDMIAFDGANHVRVVPNTTATKMFLTQTGDGTNSAVPTWQQLQAADLPSHFHSAADINSGILAVSRGGTGIGSYTVGDMLYALTSSQLSRVTPNATTTRKFLRQVGDGTTAGAPTWDTLQAADIPSHTHSAADITSGVLGIARGGTGASTASAAFNNLAPSTTKGDLIAFDGTNHVRVVPNATTTKMFLTQTGDGVNSAVPTWQQLQAADIPTHFHNAADITTGTLGVLRGGTGVNTYTAGDMLYAATSNPSSLSRVTPNASTTRKFLRQVGDGTTAGAPTWDTLVAGDLPAHTHSAADITSGVLGVARGGTGLSAVANQALLVGTGGAALTTLPAGGVGTVLKVNTGPSVEWGLIDNSNISVSAAISVSKLAAGGANSVLWSDGATVQWTTSPTIGGLLTPAGGIAYATGVEHYWDKNGTRLSVYYGRWGAATDPSTSNGKWLKVAEFDHPSGVYSGFHLLATLHGRFSGAVSESTPTVVYASVRRQPDGSFNAARVAIWSVAEYPSFDDAAIVHRSGGSTATARTEVWVRCLSNWRNSIPVEIRINHTATLVSLATDHVAEQTSITTGYVAILAQRSVDTYPSFYVEGPATISGRLLLGDGTAAAPALSFSADTNTGIYRAAADVLGLVTAGVERARIDVYGAVIGSDPGTTSTLRVGGNAAIQGKFGRASGTSDGRISGFWVWHVGDSNHVIYSANPSGGVSPAGATLATGYWNAGHRMRFRTYYSGQGFLWENSLEQAVADLTAGTGDFWVKGIFRTGSDGTAAAPAWSFGNDTNTGIFRAAADVLGFATAGSERMRINAAGATIIGADPGGSALLRVGGNAVFNGNVGVGAVSPTAKLELANIGVQPAIKWTATGGRTYGIEPYDNRLILADLGVTRIFEYDPSGWLNLQAPGINIYLSSAGVAVGSTDPQSYKLRVAGTSKIDNDLTVGSLGVFDSTGSRYGGDVGGVSAGDVLSYDGTAGKWRPRLIQTTVGTGVMTSNAAGDGTFWTGAWDGRTLSGTPSTPSAPTVTAGYGAIIVDVGSAAPANMAWEVAYDYSNDGGSTWNTNGGAHYLVGRFVSQAIVHTIFASNGGIPSQFNQDGSTKFRYYARQVAGSTSSWSAASAVVQPLTTAQINPFTLVAASQISTVTLASIVSDMGKIGAGILQDALTSPVSAIRLSTAYNIEAGVRTYWDMPNQVIVLRDGTYDRVKLGLIGGYYGQQWRDSSGRLVMDTANSYGRLRLAVGLSNSLGPALVAQHISGRISGQSNSTSWVTFHTVTVKANTLAFDGDALEFVIWGRASDSPLGSSARLRVLYGGTQVLSWNFSSNPNFLLTLQIRRTSGTNQDIVALMLHKPAIGGNTLIEFSNAVDLGKNNGADQNLEFQVSNSANEFGSNYVTVYFDQINSKYLGVTF